MNKYLFSLLILSIAWSCKAGYLKFDPSPPGTLPNVFAKEVVTKMNEHVGYCSLSPDGKTLYYALTADEWFPSKLLRVRVGNLQQKDTLYLKNHLYEGEPFVSRDGKTMYFMAVEAPPEGAQWQSDLYRVRKTGRGWSMPERLDTLINSQASEWHISMTNKGALYFTSEREAGTNALHGDIYRVEQKGSSFVRRTKLPYPINTEFNDSYPLIDPEERFLFFPFRPAGRFRGPRHLYFFS